MTLTGYIKHNTLTNKRLMRPVPEKCSCYTYKQVLNGIRFDIVGRPPKRILYECGTEVSIQDINEIPLKNTGKNT